MPRPRVLILRAPGTNCDAETAFAFEQAGGAAECVHFNRWLETPALSDEFQIVCVPGGFSYGDDVAAGRIFANQLRNQLSESLHAFRQADKLILGICNGFQVLIKSGLLEPAGRTEPSASLTWNASGRYVDRWVNVQTDGDRCVFLAGVESLYLPIAHAEGRFVAADEATLDQLQQAGQLALRYAPRDQDDADYNPNGSIRDVAGMCDPSGRVFGLMPHPERHIDRTHHPRWTRLPDHQSGNGLAIFQNAVRYFS